jgi:transcriptional regulator with XRE-family HTH domain
VKSPKVTELLTRGDGLAARLRIARGAMKGKELAREAGWPQSKISKIEGGTQLPSAKDLETWAEHTGADAEVLTQWQAMRILAEQAQRDWAARMRMGGQTSVQMEFQQRVEAARTFRFFEVCFIPLFFQVPGYTRGVLTWVAEEEGKIAGDVTEATAARQATVNYLYTDRQFELIITESVLRTQHESMSDAVMRQQLDRLLTVDGLDNVRFGIIPTERLKKAMPVHSFEVYGHEVSIETYIDSNWEDDEAKVARYNRTMDRHWLVACEGEAARNLIHKALDALPQT